MIKIDKSLCTGCGNCVDICSTGALILNKESGKVHLYQSKCAGCGACIDECENEALSFVRKNVHRYNNIQGQATRPAV